MVEYLDFNGNKFEKGFYCRGDLSIFYFKGESNNEGFPIYESLNSKERETLCSPPFAYEFLRINKQEIEIKLKELKENASWLEERLNEI